MNDTTCFCPHDEGWARNALTRARQRREEGWTMQWCAQCDAWHVVRVVDGLVVEDR